MKVFIVDDEIVIRESIRGCALWEEGGFVLAGEAADGEMALSMLQDIRPDVLITDIKMPFMDGLELCRQVKKHLPHMKIIILSGYDDFDFARQAISLGVTDYLLKPVDEEELLPVLTRIKEEIKAQQHAQEDYLALKRQAQSGRALKEERMLRTLLEEGVVKSEEAAFLDSLRKEQIDLAARYYLVLTIDQIKSGLPLPVHARAVAAVRQVCDQFGPAVHFCEAGGLPAALVRGDGQEDLEERAYGLAQSLRAALARAGADAARIFLGRAVNSLFSARDSFRSALSLKEDAALGPGRPILGVDDLQSPPPSRLTNFSQETPIFERLRYTAAEDMEEMLRSYVRGLGQNALHSRIMGHYVYMELLLAASKLIRELGGDPQQALPEHIQDENHVASLRSEEELFALLHQMALAVAAFRDRDAAVPQSPATRKALAYLHAHYADLDLNMRGVAAYVALSGSHFCTVFSQEVGLTFTEYLTRLRIDQAKELLRASDMKMQEVAAQVGFSDRHYFSYLFKRVTGQSPSQYREQAAG